MKIFPLAANENWICDRFVNEWSSSFPDLVCENPEDADIIWLLAGWCWRHVDPSLLISKKVVITIHHIVPEKFLDEQKQEFEVRDKFIDYYHVPCQKSHDQIRQLTDKPISIIPFWVNQKIWKHIPNKNDVRKKYGINEKSFLIGSFQRDTEGSDLVSPKLEKGPDLFCDAVQRYYEIKKAQGTNVEVLLAGWRRQYVMNRLSSAGIKFYYAELPTFEILNELYNCLDLYIVASRYEGGPQAIVECASTMTPIISTDVGLASSILDEKSIFIPGNSINASPDIGTAHKNVKSLWVPNGYQSFINLFMSIS